MKSVAYWTGGENTSGDGVRTPCLLVFASSTTAMVSKGNVLLVTRSVHSTVAGPNGTIYVACGLQAAGSKLGSCEMFVAASDTTAAVAKGAFTTRTKCEGGVVSDTEFFVAGGEDAGGTNIATNEALAFSSDTVTAVAKGALPAGVASTTGASI